MAEATNESMGLDGVMRNGLNGWYSMLPEVWNGNHEVFDIHFDLGILSKVEQ